MEVRASLKYLKNAGVMAPIISTFNSLAFLLANWMDPGECRLQKFNQIALIMDAGMHVVSLLEHVDMWPLIRCMHS